MTAKDSPRIQRINAETNFGIRFGWQSRTSDRERPVLALSAAAFLGDGNRNKDYNYVYFERSDLDSNSALTALATVALAPTDSHEVRIAVQRGYSGSKVERLPHYFASKRNDHALIASARSQVLPGVTVFAEWARYTWGITSTSAEMLGYSTEPVVKSGFYVGTQAIHKIGNVLLGASITREQISRDDSLVRYLTENGALNVALGQKDEGTIGRVFFEVAGVRVGFYRNADRTPFPWLSGISPVEGDRAFQSRGTSKWGLVVRAAISLH